MKVSIQVYLLSMLVISVISNTLIRRVLEDIFRLNMKVQSILVISVTIKLHIMVK